MRRLSRLLNVEEEPRPVFPQTHRAIDRKELLRDFDVVESSLVRGRQRRAARRIARLIRIFGAVEADDSRLVVVVAHDTRVVVFRGVCRGVDAKRPVLPERGLPLSDRGAARCLPVRAESVRRVVLGTRECSGRRASRPPKDEQALRAKVADRVRAGQPPLLEAQVVVGTPGNGEVSLLRRVRSLEYADGANELGDDEVRVRVAIAVVVARVVDRNAVDGELEVLTLVRVEPTQKHLLCVARASLVREEKARGELERVGRVRSWNGLELADRHVVVGDAELSADETTADVDLFDLLAGRRCRGACGRGLLRGRSLRGRRGGLGDQLIGRGPGLDHVGRRRRGREVERYPNAARDRLAVAHRRHESPLPGGDGGRFVEVGSRRLEDVGLRHVPVRVDRDNEDYVGMLAGGNRSLRVYRVYVRDGRRRRHAAGGQ